MVFDKIGEYGISGIRVKVWCLVDMFGGHVCLLSYYLPQFILGIQESLAPNT